jgi:uncharacterized membrane protein (UPF0127 family)
MRAVIMSLVVGMTLLQCQNMQGPEVTLHTEDAEIGIQVEIAASAQERQRGLMGRDELGSREGMLFIFPALSLAPFWMENTPLSLDIIFIGEDLTVGEIAADTTPYSRELIRPKQAYRYVLEVRGGTAAAIGLKPGDRITLPDSLKR